MLPQGRPRPHLKSVETGSDAEGHDRVRMQMPFLFSVYPAPRYAFRRGMGISIPDSPIATAGALPALGLRTLAGMVQKGAAPGPASC
jgi:hypothetical protein